MIKSHLLVLFPILLNICQLQMLECFPQNLKGYHWFLWK